MTKEEQVIVTGLREIEEIIEVALALSINYPGTAQESMNRAVANMRSVLRNTYRAGRRDQYVEDEPNLKKKPTLAEKRAAHARRYQKGS